MPSRERRVDPAQIAKLYASGRWNKSEIAREYGVSRQYVSAILNKRGWRSEPRTRKPPPPRRIGAMGNVELQHRNIVVVHLYEWGMRRPHIMALTGLTRGVVVNILRSYTAHRQKPRIERP